MPTERGPSDGVASPSALRGWRTPFGDPRFWVIQALVFAIDAGHSLLEGAGILVGDSELYLLSVSVFLIPVVYAALSFGLRGAVPTVLWAVVLSVPEISHHDETTRVGIFTQFAIVLAIAVIVATGVDREKAAARAAAEVNRKLSRLNVSASALAGSLDLDHVLRSTLAAELDLRRQQVAWIRLIGAAGLPERTDIDSSQAASPSELDAVQKRLTTQVCGPGGTESAESATPPATPSSPP
ncbi:MAG: hypothetical protein R2731_05740 [Nocardioides sp.]